MLYAIVLTMCVYLLLFASLLKIYTFDYNNTSCVCLIDTQIQTNRLTWLAGRYRQAS